MEVKLAKIVRRFGDTHLRHRSTSRQRTRGLVNGNHDEKLLIRIVKKTLCDPFQKFRKIEGKQVGLWNIFHNSKNTRGI